MKHVTEFRDGDLARQLSQRIATEADPSREYHFMEFCGGHTHAISRYGVADLLPSNVKMVHGPGCPVCVLPIGRIDQAIRLALDHGVILCAYGDTLRVPASNGLSLLKAKAQGADVRMVYSPADALKLAQRHPDREVVFFAIGFETTTPPTALVVQSAQAAGLSNFSVLCCHVLTPPAIVHVLSSEEHRQIEREAGGVKLDGFVGPAHVSIIIGTEPYDGFARDHRKPVVVAGFEPLDVMQAIAMLVRQVNEGRHEVENEFTRAVVPGGNPAAKAVMDAVFTLRDSFEWRGLGDVPFSALRLRPEFAAWDAEVKFPSEYRSVPDHKQCECGAILRGVKKPQDCTLFGTVCTPESPMGSCMVSSEGACAAHYSFGRWRDIAIVSAPV